jgi:hypothetical protein
MVVEKPRRDKATMQEVRLCTPESSGAGGKGAAPGPPGGRAPGPPPRAPHPPPPPPASRGAAAPGYSALPPSFDWSFSRMRADLPERPRR